MRAVAIVGPDVSPEYLALFATSDCQIFGHTRGQPVPAADAALVFGGDGTVHHYLPDLSRLKIPVLMIPLGSGNDFAGALGLRTERVALAAWRHFRNKPDNVREVDLATIGPLAGIPMEPRFFCNVGGAGLDAEANRRANAMPRWLRGRGGYLLAILQAIRTLEALRFKVESQHAAALRNSIDEPGLMLAFANGPTYGGGLRIAPAADLSDGQLDVCFLRPLGKARLLRLLPSIFSGRHVRYPEVEYFKTARLQVETDRPTDVYADGEYVCQTPVEVNVVPRGLRVIVP